MIVGVGVGEGVASPEGVAVKAGSSTSPAAKTVNLRERIVPSSKTIVTVCSPGERSEGGVQLQLPSSLIVT